MTLSTNMVSGLSSGFDWRTMIDQLIAVDHRRVDLIESEKAAYETKLSEWQSVNTKLLALKTAAEGLKDLTDFSVFSASMGTDSANYDADEMLSVSTDATASPGSYEIIIDSLATAQKLSSNPFTGKSVELGSAYAGEFLINGKVVAVSATDTLSDVASTINTANSGSEPSGVTATVVNYGANDYRLILTSDDTGEDGISILNGAATNLVQKFGWKDNGTEAIKNSITNGAQSDRFSAHNVAVQSLLGLSDGEAATGTLKIGGTSVLIDLETDSLTDIKTRINDAAIAGVTASIVSQTEDGTTSYRLQIDGTQSFVDESNILNTLGIFDHTSTDVTGKVSGNSMTADGTYVTAGTLLTDIDGYNTHTAGGSPAGDYITLTGTSSVGGAVGPVTFDISTSTTVQDLLDEIESRFGDVIAYVTSDGKIRVDDLTGGGSLAVNLASTIQDAASSLVFVDGGANFGAASARKREVIEGADALIYVDGVEVTSSSNTVEDVISGVKLNLLQEEAGSTISLKITRDIDSLKSKISEFVSSYNTVMSYMNTQFSYDSEKEKTGGVLFSDSTLKSVKADILSLVTDTVWGVDSRFSTMGLVGINADKKMILTIDDTVLTGYLQTNFNDVMSLFIGHGTTLGSSLSYVGHGRDSQAGAYTVQIDRAATRATETGTEAAGGAAQSLTITQGTNSATISITAAMTLADIRTEINAELDAEYAEVIVGDQQLQSGGSSATADTKWGSITGTTLQNGDVISFTGTNRNGGAVSGSYTITNKATESIRGLLSKIEDAFGSEVSAAIDSSGRLAVTDKYTGTSQIAIEITEPVGRGLNFGTIDVTAGAADGSREGRYAIAVTATDDGAGHLVLRSDSYGSGSFTISQDLTDGNYNSIRYTATGNTTAATDGAVSITGATTWGEIYGANVTTGETITISGTDRDGNALNPLDPLDLTYNLNTANTVDDLLTRIENVFADLNNTTPSTVNAFIRDGKIYVEDQTATGASSISLTLTANNESGGSLNLGTFDQSTERHLDLGMINGTVSGQDVAGTINGEAATGSGQVLTGNDDNVNTDGLSVRYTGTSNDVEAGTVTLTIGVAALYERALYNITDSIDGYVPVREDSLETSISRFETKIEEMEARLDQKMETMIKRFVQMELALSRIQNQSAWLTSQINAAASAWR